MIENINGHKVFKIPSLKINDHNDVDYVYDDNGKIEYENFTELDLFNRFLFTDFCLENYKYQHPLMRDLTIITKLNPDDQYKTHKLAEKLFCDNPEAENIVNVILEAALYYLDIPEEKRLKKSGTIYNESQIVAFLNLVYDCCRSQNQNASVKEIKLKGKLLRKLYTKLILKLDFHEDADEQSLERMQYVYALRPFQINYNSFQPSLVKRIVNVF